MQIYFRGIAGQIGLINEYELAPYQYLSNNGEADAYSRYNSLKRRLQSFCQSMESLLPDQGIRPFVTALI